MDLKIFNRELELIGIIDNFTSLMWTRRYLKTGEFQLVAPLTMDNINLLTRENIIFKGNGDTEAGYIETINITLNENNEEIIKVNGKFITSYLDRRIVWGNNILRTTAELGMRKLIDENAINSTEERIIPNLTLGELKGYKDKLNKSISYKTLLEAMEEIAESKGLGFRNNFDHINKKIVFEVYKGVNRSVNQTAIAPCIFSRDFENILQQEYMDSLNNFKNVTLVAGAGEGVKRRKTVIGYAEKLDRFELYTDARDISDTKTISVPKENPDTGENEVDENGNVIYEDKEVPIPDSEYIPLLKQRGTEKLAENTEIKTFESTVNTKGNNIYKVDYDLGDIVTVADKKWGITIDTRVTEIEEIYESGEVKINVTFGNNIPTILDKMKGLIK